MWNVLLVFWTAFTTVKYFNMRNEILEKDVKIVELERVKQKLLSNLVILNKDLSNVNNFFRTVAENGNHTNGKSAETNWGVSPAFRIA